jgi:putative flippase GtrA
VSLLRQGRLFLLAGAAQLLLDWAVFVALTALGMRAAPANICGRIAGALLGFWLNGRWTFAEKGQAKLGWRRLVRFVLVWSALTAISTLLVSAVDARLSLQHAWLAKPLVEALMAAVGFFLWKHVVYR